MKTIILPLLAVLLLAGCASKPDPTLLDLTLNASAEQNPDQNARPSPMVLRLIELKSVTTFENADFFSLYDDTKAALGPDFVASQNVVLRPGQKESLKLKFHPGSQYVGVVAAYRNLDGARWRYLLTLKLESRNSIELETTKNAIVRIERVNKPYWQRKQEEKKASHG